MAEGFDLRNETRFLLGCVRSAIEGRRDLTEAFDSTQVDWSNTLAVVDWAGIGPLIETPLQDAASRQSRPDVLQMLRRRGQANAAAAVLRTRELASVLDALNARGVDVIMLKGAALAETVYANRASRPMGDIDVLVRHADLSQAEETLRELGYVCGRQRLPRARDYHIEYVKAGTTPIELHWNLEYPDSHVTFDIDRIWERAVAARIDSRPAFVMAPEDMLVHLCCHLTYHHKLRRSFQGLCDVTLVVHRYRDQLDWTRAVDCATRAHAARHVHMTLQLALELLNAPVPQTALSVLGPERLGHDVVVTAAQTLLETSFATPLTTTFACFWSTSSASERLRALGQAFSPSTVAHNYDASGALRACLYYPVRVAHLVAHYTPVVVRLVAGDRVSKNAVVRQLALMRLDKWLAS